MRLLKIFSLILLAVVVEWQVAAGDASSQPSQEDTTPPARPTTASSAVTTSISTSQTTTVPLVYNAITDLQVRPEPELPKLGPAGTIITDATFGSRILRVTDADTRPDKPGSSFTTTAGGFVNTWNSDSTMFYVLGPSGAIPFSFDAATVSAKRLPAPDGKAGGMILPGHGPFSYHKPSIMYIVQGMGVGEYDFKTGKTAHILDAMKLGGDLVKKPEHPYGYTPSVSDDDDRFCQAFGGFQDEFPYVVWYERSTGAKHLLNTVDSKLDGKDTRIKLGWGIHSAYMDRTGRYVVIGKGSGRAGGGASEWLVWDVLANDSGGNVADIQKNWSGHEVSGYGWRINQSGYYGKGGGTKDFYEGVFWKIRPLALDKLDQTRDLIAPEHTPTPHPGSTDSHLSWHNAQKDVLVPVICSIDRQGSKGPWRLYDNEIIAIRTDGQRETVWRIAHNRTVYEGDKVDFWDSSRGNVSQDGKWYIFTSNWGRSLGAAGKNIRTDVFLVDLLSAHGPGAQKPASTTQASTAPTTTSAPVEITATGPLPEGNIGIAARYPGDKNIASDPAVIFADDFEGYTKPAELGKRWDNVFQRQHVSITTQPANVCFGKQALEFTLPKQEAELSDAVEKVLKQERDILFLRYYSKYESPYDVVGSSHNGAGISAHYNDAKGNATPGIPADGKNKFLVNLETWRGEAATPSPGNLNVYVYHPGQRDKWGDHFYPTGLVMPNTSLAFDYGPRFVKRPDITPKLDRWYCYDFMVKANTPGRDGGKGKPDGRVAIWVDGKLAADFPHLRLRDVESLKIDRFGLCFHIKSNPKGPCRKWYDNVVAATSYIGPVSP